MKSSRQLFILKHLEKVSEISRHSERVNCSCFLDAVVNFVVGWCEPYIIFPEQSMWQILNDSSIELASQFNERDSVHLSFCFYSFCLLAA